MKVRRCDGKDTCTKAKVRRIEDSVLNCLLTWLLNVARQFGLPSENLEYKRNRSYNRIIHVFGFS